MNEALQHLRNSLDASNRADWRIVCEDNTVIVVSPGGQRWLARSDADDDSIQKLTRPEER